MNCLFVELYYEFKRSQGYSELEILRKREALENVLIPYRLEENIELFRRNGSIWWRHSSSGSISRVFSASRGPRRPAQGESGSGRGALGRKCLECGSDTAI